jgi:DNA invertase Pin-like site-specific DNA recombinase
VCPLQVASLESSYLSPKNGPTVHTLSGLLCFVGNRLESWCAVTTKPTAFLYGRVSTQEQDESMQTQEMIRYAKARDWEMELFSDHGWSGGKESRPELDRMLTLCRKRKCDIVLVYRFDRFARSLKQLVNALAEFDALGIQFVSVHEGVDTSSANGRLIFGIFAAIAEFERELIRQRTRSAMAHAKARGIHVGRPNKIGSLDTRYIAHQRAQGATWDAIAAELKVSVATCQRALQKAVPEKDAKPIVLQ